MSVLRDSMMKDPSVRHRVDAVKQEPLCHYTPHGGISDGSDSESKVNTPGNPDKLNVGRLVIKVLGNEVYEESQSEVINTLSKILGIKVVMETGHSSEKCQLSGSNSHLNSASARNGFSIECTDARVTADDEDVKELTGLTTRSDSVINSVLNSIRELANRLSRQEQLRDCPICGDTVTGFHYGVQTCESCKGFFKRTVQNKKLFKCHRNGNCEVVLANRKKCPACRFKKCCDVGMKIEGIREDRSRGGRSSYEGASAFLSRRIKRNSDSPEAPLKRMKLGDGSSQPVSPETDTPKRVIPVLLKELVKLEQIYEEDDQTPKPCCQKLLGNTDTDKFRSMLHITEHRLYKIVRWTRNIPNFLDIHTDDQILLLQNAWTEITCLGAIWRSRFTPGVIKLSFGKEIDISSAREMDHEEVITRMLHVSDMFRKHNIDEYEYVGIKVLAIMLPDVKGVKNKKAIQDYQEALLESLMIYSSTRYPEQHLRFGELLLRLSEVQRLASLSRNQIVQLKAKGGFDAEHIPCDYGLIMELLRHHVQYDDRDQTQPEFAMDMIAGPYYSNNYSYSSAPTVHGTTTNSPEQTSVEIVPPATLSPHKQSGNTISADESTSSIPESSSPGCHSFFYNQPNSNEPVALLNHDLSSKDNITRIKSMNGSPSRSPAKKYEDLSTHTRTWSSLDNRYGKPADYSMYNLAGDIWNKSHANLSDTSPEQEHITRAMVGQYLTSQQMLAHGSWQSNSSPVRFSSIGEDYSYPVRAGDTLGSKTT